MQAQKEAPPDMQCRDKFLLQSAAASGEFQGASEKDITPEMFSKESGNQVDECRLRVSYVAPRQPPSLVQEGAEEGTSPTALVSENGTTNTLDTNGVSRTYVKPQENTAESRALISKLSEEKNSAIQHNKKLRQELELLKRESSRNHGGIPFMYVILIGLIGLLLGYLFKKM